MLVSSLLLTGARAALSQLFRSGHAPASDAHATVLSSDFAFSSSIAKCWRSHIFLRRNICAGCLHNRQRLSRGRSFAPLRMIPENKQSSPAGKAARAGFPIRSALGRRRHLAIGEPKAKTELSTAASRRQARAVLRIGLPATGLPKSTRKTAPTGASLFFPCFPLDGGKPAYYDCGAMKETQ